MDNIGITLVSTPRPGRPARPPIQRRSNGQRAHRRVAHRWSRSASGSRATCLPGCRVRVHRVRERALVRAGADLRPLHLASDRSSNCVGGCSPVPVRPVHRLRADRSGAARFRHRCRWHRLWLDRRRHRRGRHQRNQWSVSGLQDLPGWLVGCRGSEHDRAMPPRSGPSLVEEASQRGPRGSIVAMSVPPDPTPPRSIRTRSHQARAHPYVASDLTRLPDR